MRIAFVGNRKNLDSDGKSFNTEAHIAATFETLGCEVDFIQEDIIQPNQLVDRVRGSNLFFWVRTWEGFVTHDDLKAIRALGIPSVNYHLDAFIGLGREKSLDTDPRWKCDLVFTADGDPRSAEIFKAKGINHYFLWPGVFEPEAYLLDLPRKQHEIIFVGSWRNYHSEWPYRERLVRWLMQTYGNRFEVWGPQGKGLVRGAELNRLYASTAITIGDTLCKDFKHERYISDRVMEGLGRGSFMIHPYVKGIEECFEIGKELVTYEYGNFEQLADLIQYYSSHDEERETIRRAGYERVKKDHTYTNRMRQLLEIVSKQTLVDGINAFARNIDQANKNSELESLNPQNTSLADVVIDRMKSRATHLNLGAGKDIKTGKEWLNLDHLPLPGIQVVHNLVFLPYPFEDEQFEFVQALDVIEHLPNYTPDWKPMIVAFIEEMYRILKRGGTLYMQTPGYNAEFAWQDITHVRAFHPKSFDLFDENTEFGRTTSFYSKARFSVRNEELPNHNLRFWLTKREPEEVKQ